MTETTTHKIKKWENIEVERSASEAQRRETEDLRIKDEIIERYKNPSSDTPFSLEYAYYLLGDVTEKIVLDYGCGMGENSVLIASHGGNSIGVDISPDLIILAEKRLNQHGFENKAQFKVGSAHELPIENESVNVVFGMAILHHLDLDLSSKEVFRVLKKDGKAIFLEPVRNSKLMWFIRNLIPYQQPDISPFERPLTDKELQDFAKDFSSYKSRAFNLPFVNLIEVLGLSDKILYSAIRFDGKLLNNFKFLNYYATIRVIELIK